MPTLPYSDDFFEVPQEIEIENNEIAETSKKATNCSKKIASRTQSNVFSKS